MSTRREYVICCDADDCTARYCCGSESAWQTRDLALCEGWTQVVPQREKRMGPVKSQDLCPAHSKARAA